MNSRKLWAGRSSSQTAALLDLFNSSFHFDFILWSYDLAGSRAHVQMLAAQKIIEEEACQDILRGLTKIEQEIEPDPEAWYQARRDEEDIHMAIENRLTELIGENAKKLHTARSRNDQVALDLRLWLIEEQKKTFKLLQDLRSTLLNLAERDSNQILPGYTHLQKAQPISLGHHWLAHYERITRDGKRLSEIHQRVQENPLGAGALAGTTYPIDRLQTTKSLNLKMACTNSLDAVSDRDFVAEHQFFSALLMVHLSQMAEELILWSSAEFNFIELDDRFATGSSMMPQKKNPDIPELLRGKTGRVLGNLQAILVVLKGLPLAYNKDLQEDKEGLFDTCRTILLALQVITAFLESIKINKQSLQKALVDGFLNATDAADYLVKKGVSFREAYQAVGEAVQFCLQNKKSLIDLTQVEWQKFHTLFSLNSNLKDHLQLENCLQKRLSFGGTSPTRVREQIPQKREEIKGERLI